MHEISIIISNFNGSKYLERLLQSLKMQIGVHCEIIVVDRNSSDASDSILSEHPEAKVIKHLPESGLVSGYHEGFKVATKNLLFFMNEDMWAATDCLKLCCDLAISSPQVAAVMPVQWTYDGSGLLNSGIWYEPTLWNRGGFCRPFPHLTNTAARVPYANAGACLVKREAYVLAGGWDTSFFLDDEDVELGVRLWQHGLEVWVEPQATIGHALGASNTKVLPSIGSTVGIRRYIGALSNAMVMGFKTFSLHACLRPCLVWADRMTRNLLCLRWDYLRLDFLAALLTIRRLGDVAEYRARHRDLNRRRPGEGFFFEPLHQPSAVKNNISKRRNVLKEAVEAGVETPMHA
jgi:GT2 family glycosyltransferase